VPAPPEEVVQSKYDDPLGAHGFNAVPAKISFCVSTTIFDKLVLSARVFPELKVTVNEPFPLLDPPVSAEIAEIYA